MSQLLSDTPQTREECVSLLFSGIQPEYCTSGLAYSITHTIGLDSPQPVSYTHLDVYKRQAQTVTLSNPVTLHGLPVTSTGNVTIDGQQYAADKLGYEDGLWGILRRVGYYVSNSPKIVQVNPSGEPHLFKITDPTVANNFKIGSKLVCNKYIEGRTSYDNFVIESYRGEENCPYIGDDRFDNCLLYTSRCV